MKAIIKAGGRGDKYHEILLVEENGETTSMKVNEIEIKVDHCFDLQTHFVPVREMIGYFVVARETSRVLKAVMDLNGTINGFK